MCSVASSACLWVPEYGLGVVKSWGGEGHLCKSHCTAIVKSVSSRGVGVNGGRCASNITVLHLSTRLRRPHTSKTGQVRVEARSPADLAGFRRLLFSLAWDVQCVLPRSASFLAPGPAKSHLAVELCSLLVRFCQCQRVLFEAMPTGKPAIPPFAVVFAIGFRLACVGRTFRHHRVPRERVLRQRAAQAVASAWATPTAQAAVSASSGVTVCRASTPAAQAAASASSGVTVCRAFRLKLNKVCRAFRLKLNKNNHGWIHQ